MTTSIEVTKLIFLLIIFLKSSVADEPTVKFTISTGDDNKPLGMDIFILDSYVVILFSNKWTSWELFVGTQITPQGWIFWTTIFYHQKIQVKSYLMRGQT
jgi:hypothetical protein